MRVARFHRIVALDAGQLRNQQLRDQPAHNINEEQAQQLLPQSHDVHPHKRDIEQICEGDDELIDEELDDDAVLVAAVREVLLVLGEPFGQRPVDLLVEDVCHQHVHQVRDLRPARCRVEDASRSSPC